MVCRGAPVSRVLFRRQTGGSDHLSAASVAERLMRRLVGSGGQPAPPKRRFPTVLLQVGFARPAPFGAAGALLPHHFTLTAPSRTSPRALAKSGGLFLWHFPSSHPDQPLAGTRARWSPDFPQTQTHLSPRSLGALGASIIAQDHVRVPSRDRSLRLLTENGGGARSSGATRSLHPSRAKSRSPVRRVSSIG